MISTIQFRQVIMVAKLYVNSDCFIGRLKHFILFTFLFTAFGTSVKEVPEKADSGLDVEVPVASAAMRILYQNSWKHPLVVRFIDLLC